MEEEVGGGTDCYWIDSSTLRMLPIDIFYNPFTILEHSTPKPPFFRIDSKHQWWYSERFVVLSAH
jgi:hypothetical protein